MAQPILSSFDDETKDFVLGELDDLGAASVIAGLEAILIEEAGGTIAHGVTDEMYDGSAAMAVASADMVAIALGHPREDEDAEVLAALEPHAEELRAETGLADLAGRALAVIADPDNARFAGRKGACKTAAEFRVLLTDVQTRVARAKVDHPGTWSLVPVEAGAFTITMHPDTSETP